MFFVIAHLSIVCESEELATTTEREDATVLHCEFVELSNVFHYDAVQPDLYFTIHVRCGSQACAFKKQHKKLSVRAPVHGIVLGGGVVYVQQLATKEKQLSFVDWFAENDASMNFHRHRG